MNKSSISNCSIIEVPKIKNRAGNISPIHGEIDIPFKVRRVFYLYDIPGGENRGAHAHKKCHQFLIAASGSFNVLVDDGNNRKKISLNRPYNGLYIPPGIWAEELGFSSGSICLVLTSHKYDATDYIRNYNDYIRTKLSKG
ncbi:MAG: WxcM-like domain-containing protein [Pelagibacterales bacterium]|nr:WxcM-like domain-containing protein [Pelagibacterales bacterium]